jgi:small subunit ribosomal protein S1
MTDRKPSDTSSEEDFAAMFAASERETGHARRPRFAIGDRVRGKIVSIGQEVTVIELAGGGEGTLETLELRDEDGQLTVKEGDTLEARVIAHGEKQGFVTLRRGPGQGGRTNLAEAVATGLPVEGVITGVNKGGLEVDVGGVRAFCPLSQLELRPVDDPADYVGRRLSFRVTRHEEDRRGTNVVLSRRALLEEEARGRAAETRGKVVVGAVLPGVVTALKDFGAFVDVGGIEGLLPASEISFDRGVRPADVLTVGQPVTVQVMRVEKRDDPKRPEQVSFSLKALERDPWQDAAAQFPAGTSVRGQVMRTESFGAFVQLTPGVEGLIHISELGAQRPLRHARDAVKPGDPLDVTVLALEPDKRRISLGLAGREVTVDDEGRAAAARASGGGGGKGGMGTLGDLLKGKLPGR